MNGGGKAVPVPLFPGGLVECFFAPMAVAGTSAAAQASAATIENDFPDSMVDFSQTAPDVARRHCDLMMLQAAEPAGIVLQGMARFGRHPDDAELPKVNSRRRRWRFFRLARGKQP